MARSLCCSTVCPALTPASCAAQCTRFIYSYMAFAGFSIFFTLTGLVALQLVVRFSVVLDAVSFTFILYNFAVRLCLLPQEIGRCSLHLRAARLKWTPVLPGTPAVWTSGHACVLRQQQMVMGYLAMPEAMSGLDKCQQPCLCMQREFCLRTQAVSARDVPILIPPLTLGYNARACNTILCGRWWRDGAHLVALPLSLEQGLPADPQALF